MRLAIVGGGGFRVPLIYRALLADHGQPRIDEVALYDTDPVRLGVIERVLREQGDSVSDAPRVRATPELAEALAGADFVFLAMRVGGTAGRVVDEQAALRLGLLGQETTGAGGIAFALRTVPVALQVARAIAEICPAAWVVNFTNPAGIVTEAMASVLGDRVIGVCDSPAGLVSRAARAAGRDPSRVTADYVGLNHLGWLRHLYDGETDVLPALLASERLARVEEARLFGLDWVRALRAIPNEYLYFYYYRRESIAAIEDAPATRGAFLATQQTAFYREAAGTDDGVLALWERARRRRDETYLAELRDATDTGARDEVDIDEGGYEKVALALMASLLRGEPTRLILNVRCGGTVAGLPPDGVIEVPCDVTADGPRPVLLEPVSPHQLGLMLEVKAAEQLTIEAARTGSKELARQALALHPLVDSVTVAGQVLASYLRRSPELTAALPH